MLTKITDDLWVDLKRIVEIEFFVDYECSIRYLGKENEVRTIHGEDNCIGLKKAIQEYYEMNMRHEFKTYADYKNNEFKKAAQQQSDTGLRALWYGNNE